MCNNMENNHRHGFAHEVAALRMVRHNPAMWAYSTHMGPILH